MSSWNKKRLAVLATVIDSGQPQAASIRMAVTPQVECHFRRGEEFAKISELEEKSARRLGSGPHNASFRAV